MAKQESIINRLFGGLGATPQLASFYDGKTMAKVMSEFNTSNTFVRIGMGFINLLISLVLCDVAVARDADGNIYIERRSRSYPQTYCIIINKDENKIYAAIEKDDKSHEPFGEKEWKYTLPIFLPIYFVEENPSWKPVLKGIVEDIRNKAMVAESRELEKFFDALYFWSKGTVLGQNSLDQVAMIDQFPTGCIKINAELGIEDHSFEHIVILNESTSTEEGPIREMKSELDRLNTLKDIARPLTEKYRASLPEDIKARIPQESQFETYIVTEELVNLVKHLIRSLKTGRMRGLSAYLASEPGSGKTSVGAAVAYVLGLPLYYVQFSANADESSIVGTTLASNGVFNTSAETEYMLCHRYGGVVVLDDINYAKTAVSVLMNSVLEQPFTIKGADNVLYPRNPFSIIIATVNPAAKGAHEVNEAFKSRFGFKTNWPKLPKEKMVKMVVDQSGLKIKSMVGTMVDVADNINKYLREEQIGTPITPRDIVDWAALTLTEATPLAELSNPDYEADTDYLDPISAAKDTILCATGLDDEGDDDTDTNEIQSLIAAKFVAPKKKRNELGL